MEYRRLIFRTHAVQRMFRRRISANEVETVLRDGKTIEAYPDDEPFPSRLLLGFVGGRPLHVVVAEERETATCIIVTAYEPDPELWELGFERKRR